MVLMFSNRMILEMKNIIPKCLELNKMKSVKSGLSCFTFGKRTANFIIQRLRSRQYVFYAGCQSQLVKLANETYEGRKTMLVQLDKSVLTNNCYGYERFNLLKTRSSIHMVFHYDNGGFCKQTSYLGQQQLRSFSTGEIKGKVTSTTDSESANEHWGPYLVSRIHSLEELSRFHGYSTLRWGLSIVVALLVSVYVFRDRLRDNVADEVADVASRSMGKNVLYYSL